MTIKFIEPKLNDNFTYKVEMVKLGKQISLTVKNFIKINLVPLVFKK